MSVPRLALLFFVAALPLGAARASAHCDALDGPVAVDARAAFAAGRVDPVLKWVTAADEPEIRARFTEALTVRAHGGPAKELAERSFLETLVRIHRAGEGFPYTGLKPAGKTPPAIAMADRSLEEASVDALLDAFRKHFEREAREKFAKAVAAAKTRDSDPVSGRAAVAAYVDFVHYVVGVHDAIEGKGGPHVD
jgi:hypothetical protein